MTAINPDGTIKWQFCASAEFGNECEMRNTLNVAVQAGPALDAQGAVAFGGWGGRFFVLEEGEH